MGGGEGRKAADDVGAVEAASGCLGCLLALVAGLSVLGGVVVVIDGFVMAPKIDVSHRCAPGASGRCFTARAGVVVPGGDDDEVRVRLETGTEEFLLAADSRPAAGARVRVERWDGHDVAVVDLTTEHRYHTDLWPRPWDPYGLGALAVGLALAGGAWALIRYAGR